jgi:ribosomal-protein-alanine N-acetyltransferase
VVAHPGLRVLMLPMHVDDLPAVHAIERQSFSTPWPPHAYRAELEANQLAHYICTWVGGRIVGYAGMWLLIALLDAAVQRGARDATLEVRVSNVAARRLYEKFGFRPVGVRPRYYSDDGEDALVMTTLAFDEPAMRRRLDRLRAEIAASPEPEPPDDGATIEAHG